MGHEVNVIRWLVQHGPVCPVASTHGLRLHITSLLWLVWRIFPTSVL